MTAHPDAALAALAEGDAALTRGFPADAAEGFRRALALFRAPRIRLGEANALRGLSQCELAAGKTEVAEAHAREAVRAYQDLRADLEQGDGNSADAMMWRDALEAEASSLVLLAEILLRQGQGAGARECLSFARATYQELGVTASEGGSLAGMGRVALREGRLRDAEDAFLAALNAHRANGHLAGQVGAWLHLAELYRIEGRLEDAERALNAARPIAHDAESPLLVARVLGALGAVMLQIPRPGSAKSLYEEALPRVREARDREMEGFVQLGLGQALSRLDEPGAEEHLAAGLGILAELGHRHGLAGGFHRLSEHAFRHHRYQGALVAAVAALALWQETDPVRGVGQALRMVVKSLGAMGHYREALTAALAREAIAGAVQPNAREVAQYYRDHLPAEWVAELAQLSPADKLREARLRISGVLAEADVPVELAQLATVEGALEALPEMLREATTPVRATDVGPAPAELSSPSAGEALPIAADTPVAPEESR